MAWPISKYQKAHLIDLLRSMSAFHGSFPQLVADQLSNVFIDVTLDPNGNLLVGAYLINARPQPLVLRPRVKINGVPVDHEEIPNEGDPSIFGSDLIIAISNLFDIELSPRLTGRGFAYNAMIDDLERIFQNK
jgi:hypothetical protein